MNLFILLNQTTGIWKPFAWIIGKIFNAIYEFLCLLNGGNAANIGLCLIILTIVVKLLMTPLSIKQQKYTVLQSKISPELQEIQQKYKGKTDTASRQAMAQEQQALYEKYGTSPTAGCLPMLITLPIMFGLYKVIYAIPAYVTRIYKIFEPVATQIQKLTTNVEVLGMTPNSNSVNDVIDKLYTLNGEKWAELAKELPQLSTMINESAASILHINEFLGLNLLDTPISHGFFTFALLIPILAAATQFLSTKLMRIGQPKQEIDPENTMAQSMNAMTNFMPIMSGVFCLMLSNCIGIYWIINTVVSIAQTMVINLYINKIGVDSIIEKNLEKQRIRREKMGISTSGNAMNSLATTQTKSINYAEKVKSISDYAGQTSTKKEKNYSGNSEDILKNEKYKEEKGNASSISDFANILRRRDEE